MRSMIVAVCVLLIGCGGGGGGTTAPPGVASAVLTISWPGRSRLVPFAAESVRVTFQRGSEVLATRLLARPVGGGQSKLTVEGLYSGTLTLLAAAHPNSDGTGIAQASGQTQVSLAANQLTPVQIRMDSSISRIDLGVSGGAALMPGLSAQVTVSARDRDDAVVLTASQTFTWSSANPAFLAVDGSGRLTGLKPTGISPGPVEVSVSESESGKVGTIRIEVRSNTSVSINPNPAAVRVGARLSFAAAVTNAPYQAVTWRLQEGNAGGSISETGEYTAPQSPGTYHVIATSSYDNSKSASAAVTVSTSDAVVTISPNRAWIGVGERLQFAASVANVPSQAVTWSIQEGAAGGSITPGGLYSTPIKGGDYHIIVTSQFDPTAWAIATVTVEEPPPPP